MKYKVTLRVDVEFESLHIPTITEINKDSHDFIINIESGKYVINNARISGVELNNLKWIEEEKKIWARPKQEQ